MRVFLAFVLFLVAASSVHAQGVGYPIIPATGGSGGASDLDALTDVTLTSPADGDILARGSGDWVNTALFDTGTTDIATARMSANWASAAPTCNFTGAVFFWDGTKISCGNNHRIGGTADSDLSFGNWGGTLKLGDGNASKVALSLRYKDNSGWYAGGADHQWLWASNGSRFFQLGGAHTVEIQNGTPTTGSTSVVVKAGAGQSTNDLTQWQDNAGNVLARIRSDGDLESPNILTDVTLTSPAADELVRYNGSAWVNSADRVSTFAPTGAKGGNIWIGGGGTAANGTGTQSSENTALGAGALALLTTGFGNTVIGDNAAGKLTTGFSNVVIGEDAGRDITNSVNNIFVGRFAGFNGNGQSNGVYIGNEARSTAGALSEIVIGAYAPANGTNTATYGSTVMTRHIFTAGTVEADDLQVYDDTPTTGVTTAVVQAGAGQGLNDLLALKNAAGSTVSRFNNEGSLDMGVAQILLGNGYFARWQTGALNLSSSHHVRWSSGAASGPHDVGLTRASAGLLRVTNGAATMATNGALEAGDLTVYDNTPTTGVTTAVVKAGADQSTTDLTQWQDNAGAVLARVRSDGDLESPNVLTEDTDDRTTGFIGTDTAEAGTTTTNLTMTAHGLTTGQVVCNVTRSACVSVFAVPDADNVTLATAITGQTSGDAIRTYDYPNRRSSWYHQTTPIDDIFLDNIPLGSIEMTWDAAPTRNFDSLIYLDLPAGAAIDKGRGLFVWNHGSSDGINVLADNGGVAAAFICGDAATPTNNSFCEAHEVRSPTSIGSYVRSTATAGGPHLMFLDQQSTAAAKPTAMIDITGNAAHTGFNVKNSGGNASVIYYQALDSEGDVRFQMSGNGIELGDTGDDSAATTFDFHSGSATADYDARILATGGAGTSGTGTLTFYAGTVNMSGLTLKADDLDLDDGGTKPTCDSSQRGKFWFEEGAVGVADTVEICGKDAANAYAWKAIATF